MLPLWLVWNADSYKEPFLDISFVVVNGNCQHSANKFFNLFCQVGDPDKKHSSRECDENRPGRLLLRTVMADEDQHPPPGMKLAEQVAS